MNERMSGEKQVQLKSLCAHCTWHSLNLVILNSCFVLSIRNCIDQMKHSPFGLSILQGERKRLLKRMLVDGKDSHNITHS